MTNQKIIDCAGARMGGAARFVRELKSFLDSSDHPDVSLMGCERTLSPGWLLERELLAGRSADRIALNNVSFVRAGGTRTVLLRNALHFVRSTELENLGIVLPPSIRGQRYVVRAAAKRADVIVVPSRSMARRVKEMLPSVAPRIRVRHHPVAARPWAGEKPRGAELLVPILNAPYKKLDAHLRSILRCAGDEVSAIHVTGQPQDFPLDVRQDPRVNFIGELSSRELDAYWQRSRAAYYPTELESFGYPLAEARANGRRVVALDTPQNREIAGQALAAFTHGSDEELRGALAVAMAVSVPPDLDAFDPRRYFTELLRGAGG